MIKSFELRVKNKTLDAFYKKINGYPWIGIENIEGWTHGTNYNYLKNISKYSYYRFNFVRWTKMSGVNHFAALEEPGLFIKDIKSFFKKI